MSKDLDVGKNLAHVRSWKAARVAEAQGTREGLAEARFYSIF